MFDSSASQEMLSVLVFQTKSKRNLFHSLLKRLLVLNQFHISI